MMRRRLLLVLAGGLVLLADAAQAQNSIYGVRGVGFPSRMVSARARGLGGGLGLFDPLSQRNPAAATLLPQVTASATVGGEFRQYDVNGLTVDGIHSTRFPLGQVGGPVGRLPLAYTVGFGSYAERSFDVTATDTILLRGNPVEVRDRIQADGGIADVRGALAWAPSRGVRVGAAVHLISGSTKLRVRREFSDSTFRNYRQDNDAGFSAVGVSVGTILVPSPRLQLAATARFDGRMNTTVDSVARGQIDLPVTLAGGIIFSLHPAILWSASASWTSWSEAQADLDPGTAAFDTWEAGTGIEIGGPATGTSRIPLRLGFRYAQLPFAPAGSGQPRELTFAAGTGLPFAGNRAMLDLAVERVLRDGAGVTERAWQVVLGILVRP